MVKLGAGCGLPSIALAKTGRRIVATDAADPDVLSNLRHNAHTNSAEVEVLRYQWGSPLPAELRRALKNKQVHMLGSDLIYGGPGAQRLLTAALRDIFEVCEPRVVLACMERPHHRDALEGQVGELAAIGLECREFVPKNDAGSWMVPQLLAGSHRT